MPCPSRSAGAFATWARQVENGIARLTDALPRLMLLPQGGTAAGTG
jgi:fumarate hydratase, class II